MPTTCNDWPRAILHLFDNPTNLNVHAGCANSLRRIDAGWRAHGGASSYRIVSIGGYNCRTITGGSIISAHGLGLAVDVNPAQNPYTSGPTVTDMPAWFVALWKAEGWGWGGDWTGSHRDAMHFSKLAREYGDGKLEEPA